MIPPSISARCAAALLFAQACYSPGWNGPVGAGKSNAITDTPPAAGGAPPSSGEAGESAAPNSPLDGSDRALGEIPRRKGAGPEDAVEAPRVPAPCAGIPYTARVTAPPGLHFALRSTPPSFAFDAGTGTITGTPGAEDGGRMELDLLDASGMVQRRATIDLELREDCWLAYLADREPGLTRLHLTDVFATEDVDLPVAEADATVQDFAFSPDGSWLAFRATRDGRQQLHLYPVRQPLAAREERVDFDCAALDPNASCSVLDYAWSRDSRRLAVVASGSAREQDYLSGVDIGDAPGTPWPLSREATWGVSTIPLDYRSQLTWSASGEAIAFLGADVGSPEPSLPDALYSVSVTRRGEGSALDGLRGITSVSPPPGSELRAAAAGWALIYRDVADSRLLAFHARPSTGDPVLAFLEGLVSPSGLWVANVDLDGRLGISDIASGELKSVSDPGVCEQLIAWSEPRRTDGNELLACSDARGLRIFAYSVARARLEPPEGAAVALNTRWSGARRAFSPSGTALVIGSDQGDFSLVDVSVAPPSIIEPPLHFEPPAELALPAGREVVAIGNAAALLEYPLPAVVEGVGGYARGPEAPLARCEEYFWAAPANWCGAPKVPGHFVYSGDAESLLFESAPAVLSIALRGAPEPSTLTSALPSCSVDCPQTPYAFKP